MLNIDTETMLIELTRGDTANIVFSAVDKDGNTYEPTGGDILTFAVAKKVGAEPLSFVANEYDGVDEEGFWTITIGAVDSDFWTDESGADKFKFADYVWDVQLTTSTGVDTIIGKTSTLSPKFRVLGEVAAE